MRDYSAGRNAARYWFIDGLPEILYGSMFASFGVFGVLAALFLAGPPPYAGMLAVWILALVGVAFTISMPFWDRKILEYFKSKVTYPRTGYVQPPEDADPNELNRPISLFRPAREKTNVMWFRHRTLVWMLQATNLGLLVHSPWGIALGIPLVAVLLYFLSRKTEHPYSVVSLAVLAAGGALALISPVNDPARRFLPCIWNGVWLLGLGLTKLVHYLHDNPLPKGARA